MTVGDVHTVGEGLHVIEGHHRHGRLDDPDLPTVVVYRAGRRLYILDSGAGPEQREAIRTVVKSDAGRAEEILLLNSSGHVDRHGNNDILYEIGGAASDAHYVPREARPALDAERYLRSMYQVGAAHFDYLGGRTSALAARSTTSAVSALRRAMEADERALAKTSLVGRSHSPELDVSPVFGRSVASLLAELVLQPYPPMGLRTGGMRDYEDIAPAVPIQIGATSWTGWTFPADGGSAEVQVLRSGGHSAGSVVFYLPQRRFLMMAGEALAVPLWPDSEPAKSVSTAIKALELMADGRLHTLCASRHPALPVSGSEARRALGRIVDHAARFTRTVGTVLERQPEGVSIDGLYNELARDAVPGSLLGKLLDQQFPSGPTFLQLTLLHHCQLLRLERRRTTEGYPLFWVDEGARSAGAALDQRD